MSKLLLDTNIWLRFFLRDDEKHYQEVVTLIGSIEEGTHRAYTSSLIFLELFYVLKKTYLFSNEDINDIFTSIEQVRGITILETTNSAQALTWFRKYRVKLSDCLIASTLYEDMILVTYDAEFKKIDGILVNQPSELLQPRG